MCNTFLPLWSRYAPYDIFFHTWMTPNDSQRVWHNNIATKNDPKAATVLRPKRLLIDDQSVFMRSIRANWTQFVNNHSNWDLELEENHLCALKSLERGFSLFDAREYSYVVFARPDVQWFKAIPFSNTTDRVVMPHKNDRFAKFPAHLAHIYAQRFEYASRFAHTGHRVVAEDLLMYVLAKYPTLRFTYIKEASFFKRVRPK